MRRSPQRRVPPGSPAQGAPPSVAELEREPAGPPLNQHHLADLAEALGNLLLGLARVQVPHPDLGAPRHGVPRPVYVHDPAPADRLTLQGLPSQLGDGVPGGEHVLVVHPHLVAAVDAGEGHALRLAPEVQVQGLRTDVGPYPVHKQLSQGLVVDVELYPQSPPRQLCAVDPHLRLPGGVRRLEGDLAEEVVVLRRQARDAASLGEGLLHLALLDAARDTRHLDHPRLLGALDHLQERAPGLGVVEVVDRACGPELVLVLHPVEQRGLRSALRGAVGGLLEVVGPRHAVAAHRLLVLGRRGPR
mmetsp:Transcript_119674/g.321224  ORF Transcript_119674/g.321224 Transcript_119674/m.321224 type:complete len:303 (-) Transcript_119674:37-945(-)